MNRTVATCQPISTIVFESQRTPRNLTSLKNDIGCFHITHVEWRGISKEEVGSFGWKVEKQQEVLTIVKESPVRYSTHHGNTSRYYIWWLDGADALEQPNSLPLAQLRPNFVGIMTANLTAQKAHGCFQDEPEPSRRLCLIANKIHRLASPITTNLAFFP
ncbi:hypothetical protein ALC57_11790 [Trachymyrmex cornetzi]|uniref:Uncharacterized protein n=1 Tax=Trachymyrmex cornetzi TaxID=471704 RepID=A0A151J1V7_9HYME|nr:hypothetical protein ALC57_11790 [Trachymyrmex cornetzi]